MALLYDDHSVRATLAVRKARDGYPSEAGLAGTTLLCALGINPSASSRVALSLHPCAAVSSMSSTQAQAWIFWAVWSQEPDGLIVPLEWLAGSAPTFQQHVEEQLYFVELVKPTQLDAVFISALSAEAFDTASRDQSAFEAWFRQDERMIRQGAIYTLPSSFKEEADSSALYQYKVIMAEPVTQGYSTKDATQLFISNGHDLDQQASPLQDVIDDEEDSGGDEFEIDEGFLASSVLPRMTPASTRVTSPTLEQDSGHTRANGHNAGAGEVLDTLALWTAPLERIKSASDDHSVYLRTSEAGKLGILNGDWAILNPCDSLNYRLLRVFVQDQTVPLMPTVTASPLLLRNIFSSVSSDAAKVNLRPSPFGSRVPAVPTAKSVTVARIASPLSVHRDYEALCLGSLKDYFGGTRRMVKQGDLIAVTFDTNAVQESDLDGVEDTIHKDSLNNLLTGQTFSSRRNAVVFFSVTNVEYDVLSNGDVATVPDMYIGATIGELGCWVDPAVTRLVQIGVEHSRVPDMATYFNLASPAKLLQIIRKNAGSRLLSEDSAYGKHHSLIAAAFMSHAVEYDLQLSFLLTGAAGVGKSTTALWVAQALGMHMLEVECFDLVGETDTKTEGTLRAQFDKAALCSPCVLLLRHVSALQGSSQPNEPGKEPAIASALSECIMAITNAWRESGYPVVVIGTANEPGQVDSSLLSSFKHEVNLDVPGEPERLEILTALLYGRSLAADVSLSSLAVQTAALVAQDLVDLVSRATMASIRRSMSDPRSRANEQAEGGHGEVSLTMADMDAALAAARASYSESIGAPKIPNVSWDDVGGLANVKSEILDTIQLPLEHPELFADGMKKRSGILLYGPPGTGKTLLAKAVATSCSLNFFSVKGPELLNMYIGESEANVRRVFQRARDATPCVVFFDELDSVAPKRGNHGDSGGVMDRIVSQLLAELDGMSSGKGAAEVFVIGATNRPDLLDPALLRPGRFDRMLYLGVSDNHEAQLRILEALTRKFRLDPSLDLRKIAEQCPFNYTGADFYALCSDALLKAMSRKAEEIDSMIAKMNSEPPTHRHPHPMTPQYYLAELATAQEVEVLVSQADFESAAEALVPSVSRSEMDHYNQVQQRYSQQAS